MRPPERYGYWQNKLSGPDRFVPLIAIFYILSALSKVIRRWDDVVFIFSNPGRVDGFEIIFVVDVTIALAGGIFFWRIRKAGWLILTGYQIYSSVIDIVMIVRFIVSGRVSSMNVFPGQPAGPLFLSALYSAGWVWLLMRSEVRDKFRIRRPDVIDLTCVAGACALLMTGILAGIFN